MAQKLKNGLSPVFLKSLFKPRLAEVPALKNILSKPF